MFAVSIYFLKAYLMLLLLEPYLVRGDFAALYDRVRTYPTTKKIPSEDTIERICSAVNLACILYWKKALCLQRAAVTVCLLRRHGVTAELVIGAQQSPFKAHAWVEVSGRVINDKSYVPEIYAVLDRC